MKKRLLISSVLMSAVLACALGTGTYAWYSATSNASASVGTNTTGDLSAAGSTIAAGSYTINLGVSLAKSTLELSHVVTTQEASSGLNGVTAPAAGELVYGVINQGVANMAKVETANLANYVTTYSVSASWETAPTNPADMEYFKNKTFTVDIGVEGNAKLLANSSVTGNENKTSDTVTFTITYEDSAWKFTPTALNYGYVHIEPTSISENESNTTGKVKITNTGAISFN